MPGEHMFVLHKSGRKEADSGSTNHILCLEDE